MVAMSVATYHHTVGNNQLTDLGPDALSQRYVPKDSPRHVQWYWIDGIGSDESATDRYRDSAGAITRAQLLVNGGEPLLDGDF